MNILVFGAGAREHALAWKIKQSEIVDEVFCSPGNPGMNRIGPCFDVDPSDAAAAEKLVLQLEPSLIVIGPEGPLEAGLADRLRARGFDVFGPNQNAAQLESSKVFAKQFMARNDIPTAPFAVVKQEDEIDAALQRFSAPYVLKADGLAAGKGVVIADTLDEAREAAKRMLAGQFGEASKALVIEAFMPGEEASLFVLTDGEGALVLPAVQDHKRIGEGDTGLNTGGMGAYAPAPVITAELAETIRETIILPTLKGMAKDDAPLQGVLYVGLMITADGPRVVEYNCRFGDPECQVLMKGLPGDIVPILLTCATGGLARMERDLSDLLGVDTFQPSATVIMAAPGYPEDYPKGQVIRGAYTPTTPSGVTIFQAGTDVNGKGELVSAGGRVLAITADGDSVEQALDRAYEGVAAIDWPEAYFRRDIGWRVRQR